MICEYPRKRRVLWIHDLRVNVDEAVLKEKKSTPERLLQDLRVNCDEAGGGKVLVSKK